MYDPKIHNRREFKDLRKKLRDSETKAERVLWRFLKGKALGVQFRRQFGLGRYIVDFCCWKEKLIIELDGGIHNNPKVKEYDQNRQKDLENLGFKVLRFKNYQVINHPDSVISEIKQSLPTPPIDPSPQGGGLRHAGGGSNPSTSNPICINPKLKH